MTKTKIGMTTYHTNNKRTFLNRLKRLSGIKTLNRFYFIVEYSKNEINESINYTKKQIKEALNVARIFTSTLELDVSDTRPHQRDSHRVGNSATINKSREIVGSYRTQKRE